MGKRLWIKVVATGAFLVILQMSGVIIPAFVKPSDRVYNGRYGMVDDYVGYASYIKEGMYGRNSWRNRSVPLEGQISTPSYYIYILTGRAFSFTPISAPVIFHAMRAFWGISGFTLMFILFMKFFGEKKAFAASILAATAGQMAILNLSGRFLTFGEFEFLNSASGRFAQAPHIMFGFGPFVLMTLLLLRYIFKERPMLAGVTLLISGLLQGMNHPTFCMIAFVLCLVMTFYSIIRKNRSSLSLYISSLTGLLIGGLWTYWAIHQLPWSLTLTGESLVSGSAVTFSRFVSDILAFGPVFWIGIPGLIAMMISSKFKEQDVYMTVWIITQLLLFSVLYRFLETERTRYIQSLYFIPVTYGCLRIFDVLKVKYRKKVMISVLTVLTILTMPVFIRDIYSGAYSVTDYSFYSIQSFPTMNFRKSYDWIDNNTQTESKILAKPDNAYNLLLYTHNSIYGYRAGWGWYSTEADRMEEQRDRFLSGVMADEEAKQFLKGEKISYIYQGSYDPEDSIIYSSVKLVYSNPDVKFFEVIQ